MDDEPLVRRSLARILKTEGFEVFEAEDGDAGYNAWKAFNPDIAFVDILMPGMSGPELIAKVNREGCIVILMSAYSGINTVESTVQSSADYFLAKPFENILDIVPLVQRLVEEKKSQ